MKIHYAPLFGVGFGLITGIVWRQLKLGLYFGQILFTYVLLSLILLALMLLGTVLFVKKAPSSLILGKLSMLLITIIGVLFPFQVLESYFQKSRGIEYYSTREDTESNFGTKDLISVGKFVREITDPSIILASNNFMPNRPHGGADFLLPAETRRRFLLQGLRFQTGLIDPSVEQTKRMSLSNEFADQPTRSSLNELKRYGVEGFIVNLSLTNRREWTEFADELFRSGNFVYLQLK